MIRSFGNIWRSKTLSQSMTTSLGTVINGLLGVWFYTVVARNLGPKDFGLLFFTITTITLIADIADLGISAGLVRYIPHYIDKDKTRAYRFLKLSLILKAGTWLVLAVSGFILAPVLSKLIFNTLYINPLRLAFLGVGGVLFFNFTTVTLQGLQKFLAWSLINVLSNLVRVFLVLGLIATGFLNLQTSTMIYILIPLAGFLFSGFLLPIRRIILVKDEFQVVGEFFGFNKWVALFTLFAALGDRLDTYFTARFLSSDQVGIYGVARQLSGYIPQLMGALGVVVSPKLAAMQTKSEMVRYIKKLQLFTLAIAGVILLALPIVDKLIPLIYGQAFQSSVGVFVILVIAMLVFLISLPIHSSIIYYYGKSIVFFWLSMGHLILIATAGWFLVSSYGIYGAAETVLLGTLFNFLVPLVWFLKKL